MTLTPRLLGLAFAAADALIEVDQHGVVRFALGSGAVAGQQTAAWVGHPLSDRLSINSAAVLQNLLGGLRPGQRSHLSPGIYRIRSRSKGAALMPLYLFASVAQYRAMLNWEGTVEGEARRLLPDEAAKAIRRAMETAR